MPGVSRSYGELVARTRWYVYLRWFIMLIVIIPSLVASYFALGWGGGFFRDAVFSGVALLSNCIFHVMTYTLKKRLSIKTLAYILVLADVAMITFFIYSKGGIESRSIILYILPMIASAAILGRRGIYYTTAFSIIGFTAMIFGSYLGSFGTPLSANTPLLDHNPGYVANTVIFFDCVLLVSAVAVDYLTRLLITQEEQAVEALANMSQAQLVAKTGSWELDIDTGEVHYSEELFAVMNGLLSSRVVSSDALLRSVHADDRQVVRRKFASARRRPCTFSFDTRMIARNGTVRYLHVDGRSFADRNGKVVKAIGSARDVTDEMTLQQARNDFVALASHQLRTPATIVKQYLGILKDGYAGHLEAKQREMVDIAYDTNERQIKIINDLLNVARIDSNSYKIERKRTNLSELLTFGVRDQAAKFAEKQQTLTLKKGNREIFGLVDADGLRMAIDNLLDNAHKYTPPGRGVRVVLTKRAANAVITITDRGVGIAKNDMPKMFKIFSRVENPVTLQQEGTGLGLYWAHRIVRLHKGKIAVSSEVGKGTTFTITVPLS